jgi:hypothetical protein
MASHTVGHSYEHYDWKMGLEDIKRQTLSEYGHQEGYSGQIHDVTNIRYLGTVNLKKPKDIDAYIDQRLDRLAKRQGEVISLGIIGYSIAQPVIKEYRGHISADYTEVKSSRSPAILYQIDDEHHYLRKISEGSVAELKQRAKDKIMQCKFEFDYVIVGKNIAVPLLITGEGKMVKSTTKKSDHSKLVLPYHRFVVYGWAPS